MFNLPAVSTMTTSTSPLFFASSTPFLAISGGDVSAPSSYTGTFKSFPNFFNWSIAAGLYTSVATNKHVLFCFFKLNANFPHAVVFPTPCKPAIKITVGPFPSSRKLIPSAPTPPIKAHNSSATNFTSSWLGSTPLVTFTPGALSSTRFINLLTTGKLTSASNKALLTSFKGALIFSGDKSATPFIFAHAWSNVLDKLLNASARTITDEDLSRLLPLLSFFLLPNDDDDVNADEEDKNVDFVPLLDGEKPILRLPFDDAPRLITLEKPARAVVVVVIFSRLLFQRARER
mmetsp:Transcript_3126/g.9639  ORF Transcript_3126/g.9639 Transcript_3126/m.9639 type:complete len:289 (+) Transcript_3126:2733-3599(+)